MYSKLITDKALAQVRKDGTKVKRRPIEDCQEIAQKLGDLYSNGFYSRPLTHDEQEFIRSEIILCQLDFKYFALRYGHIELDAKEGGGAHPIKFWASQERTLELMAEREEDIDKEYKKHGFSDGILLVWHKCRQEGATALGRLLSGHRMILFKNTRCFAASTDDSAVHELYTRDKVLLDNLPCFLRPKVEFDVKDQHLSFELLKSRLVYQKANQQSGVGTGRQFDVSHGTEIALWPFAERLEFDFFPAIPQSPRVFVGFESTANGRGNFWHTFTENIRLKKDGYSNWIYSFTPWYIEPTKWRRAAPDDWSPAPLTLEHAQLIDRTSPEYAGRKIEPNRDQLYWWETERELYRKNDSLHVFLTNYCATPEQSFQHSTRSALPIDTIEWMRSNAILGMPYLPTDIQQRA